MNLKNQIQREILIQNSIFNFSVFVDDKYINLQSNSILDDIVIADYFDYILFAVSSSEKKYTLNQLLKVYGVDNEYFNIIVSIINEVKVFEDLVDLAIVFEALNQYGFRREYAHTKLCNTYSLKLEQVSILTEEYEQIRKSLSNKLFQLNTFELVNTSTPKEVDHDSIKYLESKIDSKNALMQVIELLFEHCFAINQ